MTLQTPTTADINDAIITQLEASLNQTIPLLPKAFIRVLARVLAGVFILLWKYCGFNFLQVFVQTATIKETEINGKLVSPLTSWGVLIGVGPPNPATSAELQIDVTVESQVGNLSAGAQLINSENGVTYVTIATVALDAATVSVAILAVDDQVDGGGSGTIGNLEPGAIVSFANPLSNIARDAVVTAQNVTGADTEDTGVYRKRVIDNFQQRPQGGAMGDYKMWGETVAGILNVFPYTGAIPGEVDVYSEATVASSGNPDGIPTVPQLTAVFNAIELDDNGSATRRPAGAFVNSFPISRRAFDSIVTGINGVADIPTTESDVEDAITQYFRDAAPFIVGLTIPPRQDRITKSGLTAIVNEVVAAAGGTFTGVTFDLTGDVGSQDLYTLLQGEKAKIVTVTFV